MDSPCRSITLLMCYENVHCYDPSSPVPATIPCGLNAHKSMQPYSKLFLKDKIIEMLDMPWIL